MNRPPEWIVSVPAAGPEAARVEVYRAAQAGADVAEVRFDRWAPQDLDRARALFPTPLPLLATLRSTVEGGSGPDGPGERRATLLRLAELPFRYLDVELARDLPMLSPPGGATLLGSRHFAPDTALSEIDDAAVRIAPGVGRQKIVVEATVERFLEEFRPRLTRWVGPERGFFTTGPSGSFARLAAQDLGEPFAFAALPPSAGTPAPVEPSQVPVDRLRSSSDGGGRNWFAVVGSAVAHSLSPQVHNAWFRAEARPAAFVPVAIGSEHEFDLFLHEARSGRWRGWSVTSPWKGLAAVRADRRSPTVEATGSANSLRFGPEGLEAEQTDGGAIRRRVEELARGSDRPRPEVLVVGTGGAARSAVHALRSLARETLVIGRRPSAVLGLAERMGATAVTPLDARPVEFVVHATTSGRSGSGPLEPPLDDWLDAGTSVIDFVYDADEPWLGALARRKRASYEDGRRLLVYQAEEAYAWWWGRRPAAEATAAVLREIGCAA